MLNSSDSRWILSRWLPVWVAVAGISVTLIGWARLVEDRRETVREIAMDIAAASRSSIASTVRDREVALRNLARYWGAVPDRPPADADAVLESHPELVYIAFVHPDGRRGRVAPEAFDFGDVSTLVPDAGQRPELEARLTGPEFDSEGNASFRLLHPVRRGDRVLGAVESRIDVASLLHTALQDSAPGYAIQIEWSGRTIFSRGQASSDPWQEWWFEQGSVDLPYSQQWTVTHRPTAELASALLTPHPHYLLGLGVLLALALGVLSHHLRLNHLRNQRLAEGNVQLEASAGELRSLNADLEARVLERTREIESFTHSIAHDLKSPLGAILNFSSILELDYRDELDDEGRSIIRRIKRSAARGSELLEGLLRLLRAGHNDMRVSKIDMDRLAKESFSQVRQRHADLEVDLIREPLPEALGDRALIGEVFVDLFDNALKYSKHRQKSRVQVRGRIDGDECIYEVEDDGCGFDMRYANKLFGLFERLHGSRDVEGTGVGLAVVQRIVSRHGGRCWAESAVGEGSRFSFALPSKPGAP